ncbi:hypothetical protein J1N35_011742 [Gossypium stocksii]|uniref:Uncharacterized protein n=1 Tax=Gossypium stocksii TaxID=47602 RepID=A0A9D3W2Z5_9ROSI|nr:hypothetical protein J1N35_011742 [Gossypium stocksii]
MFTIIWAHFPTVDSEPLPIIKCDANPLMLTIGVDIQIVGGVGTMQGSRKTQKTNAGIANITLSNEEEGSPMGELHRKGKKDRGEASNSAVPTTIAPTVSLSLTTYLVISSPPLRPRNNDTLGVTFNHGPSRGSLKFRTPSGKTRVLFP